MVSAPSRCVRVSRCTRVALRNVSATWRAWKMVRDKHKTQNIRAVGVAAGPGRGQAKARGGSVRPRPGRTNIHHQSHLDVGQDAAVGREPGTRKGQAVTSSAAPLPLLPEQGAPTTTGERHNGLAGLQIVLLLRSSQANI